MGYLPLEHFRAAVALNRINLHRLVRTSRWFVWGFTAASCVACWWVPGMLFSMVVIAAIHHVRYRSVHSGILHLETLLAECDCVSTPDPPTRAATMEPPA